ncbi:MAG: response regulator transcription factor [Flavobacteriales bacterium]|jgi:two-component system LytT family response regulator|nr:response regulator transcription factor [Flavobacteriales bacterium]
MLLTLIVDDEKGARETLSGMLRQFCPGVQIVGEAASVAEAKNLIKLYRPQLVFLDIQMPFETGFSLLNSLETKPFHVVFTTAHNNYALKAIKFSALDYILKPIDITELQNAVQKAKNSPIGDHEQIAVLQAHGSDEEHDRIVLPYRDGFRVISCAEIVRFEGERNYSWVHFINGQKILTAKTLKEYEELLLDRHFFRAHQSHLINLKCVRGYIKGRGGQIEFVDGSVVDLARSRKQDFLAFYEMK